LIIRGAKLPAREKELSITNREGFLKFGKVDENLNFVV
jgi:hypothetical protein